MNFIYCKVYLGIKEGILGEVELFSENFRLKISRFSHSKLSKVCIILNIYIMLIKRNILFKCCS